MSVHKQGYQSIVTFKTLDCEGRKLQFIFRPKSRGASLKVYKNDRRVIECSISKSALQEVLDNFRSK